MPPIFLYHGNIDEVVPKAASQKSFDSLLKRGVKSELHFFDGGHEINNDLIDHCRGKIKQQFGANCFRKIRSKIATVCGASIIQNNLVVFYVVQKLGPSYSPAIEV